VTCPPPADGGCSATRINRRGSAGRRFDEFTGHYRDQIEPFMSGEKRYWWFSDREIASHAKTEQTLVPR
jgi:hypothetical protein